MTRCALHGGLFLVQRTTFLVQRAMFLRPLDEGGPRVPKRWARWMLLDPPRRAFLVPKCEEIAGGRPKGSRNPEKAIPKSMQKMILEKDTKCIPKAFQHDAKTDTNIFDLLYFCEKGWNAPNCLFSNRKPGSGHPTIQKSPSKINAKSMFEKGMQKVMNMISKRDQNRSPNPIKIHVKNDVDKTTT